MKMTFIESLCPECAAEAAWLKVWCQQHLPNELARAEAHYAAIQDMRADDPEMQDKYEWIIGAYIGQCEGTLTKDDRRLIPEPILRDYLAISKQRDQLG